MGAGSVAIAVAGDTGSCVWDMYEIAIACSVFGAPQSDLADPWYDLRLCSARPDVALGEQGFSLRTPYQLEGVVKADTVIVAAVSEAVVYGSEAVSPDLVEVLRQAANAGVRMVSLCDGAFALAEAGLLDGRRVAAHWMHAAELAKRYPKVRVDDSVLYVDDCDVLTSAGVTAGLDLCLHLVRCDLGAHVANQLARRMVVPATAPVVRRSSSTFPSRSPTMRASAPYSSGPRSTSISHSRSTIWPDVPA